jgi:hypothetical protein
VDGERPILALDVDGVISLFGFQTPMVDPPGRFHLIDGMAHCIPETIGERLGRLADQYDVVWATGWEDRANDHLPRILGLAEDLPFLTFDGEARFGSAHWKIAAIDRYAGDRPLAWVDDCIDERCQAWAVERSAPTLLVATEPDLGLTDKHVETLLGWVRAGYTA